MAARTGNSHCSIRRLASGDEALYFDCASLLYSRLGRKYESVRDLLAAEEMARSLPKTHACFIETELAGALVHSLEERSGDWAFVIKYVAVDPNFMGRGVGKLLVEHAERVASSTNMPCIRLDATTELTPEGISLPQWYGKRGYVITARIADPFKRGEYTVFMEKALNPAVSGSS